MSNIGFGVTADTSTLLARMVEAGNITDREAKKMQRSLQFVSDELKKISAAQKSANDVTGDMAAGTKAANDASGATAGFTRELIVLGHELSQGNYKRFGGSLLVLAEYSKTATAALHTLIGPVGLVVAAVALAGVEIVKGIREQSEFQRSLTLTGNAAGLTAGRLDDLVKATAAATNGTQGGARDALQAAISSGRFGPGQIDAVAQATIRLQRLTGEDAAKIVGDFEKMTDGVAKYAAEHNRSMHFLSAAQYEHIRTLELEGKAEQAQDAVLAALNDRLKESDKQLGFVARAWHEVTVAASAAANAVASYGRGPTVDDELSRLQARAGDLRAQMARNAQPGGGLLDMFLGRQAGKELADIDNAIGALTRAKQLGEQVAAAQARSDKVHADAIAASAVVRQITEENDKRSKATIEIERYTTAVEKMRAAADPAAPSTAEEAKVVALIRARNKNPGDKAGEEFIKNLQRQVEAQTRGRDQMLALEAAQKGVSAAAAPYIFQLAEIEDRQRRIARVVADTAEAEKQAAKETGLLAAGDAISKSYIEQAQEIGLTAEELERLNLKRKVELELQQQLSGANSETAQKLYSAAARNQQMGDEQLAALQKARRAYNADPANGVKPALQSYFDEATNGAKKMQDAITGSLHTSEDAFIEWAKTGKANAGSLFAYIAEQYLRMLFQSNAAKAITAGGGANNFSFGTLFSAIGGWFGGFLHKDGLDYVPYDGYPAILHKGERVQTSVEAAAGRGGSGSTPIDGSVHIGSVGSGVSRAEMFAAISQASTASRASIMRTLRQQGGAA